MEREFQGVIGRDWRESTPWWPPVPKAPDAAPNVLLIVLDDVGFAPARLLRLRHLDTDISIGSHAMDSGSPTSTQPRCAPRRASCLLTGRNHHRNGMGRVADLAVGYPGYWGRDPARERVPLRDPARARVRDVRRRQVAPHARRRNAHGGITRVVAARPRLRPLVRLPRRRDPPVRARALPRQPFGAAAGSARRRLPPERRPRRPRDRAPSATSAPSTTTSRSSATSRPARAIRRIMRRPNGSSATTVSSTSDGTRGATATFARQLEQRPPAARHGAHSPVRTGCRRGTRSSPRTRRSRRGSWSVSPRILSYTDAQIGRVLDFLEETGDLDNTLVIAVSDNGASAEGGERGSINDGRLVNGAPAGRRELRARIDEIGTPTAHNNYPWGWTMAGNTPFKRWKREVHEGGVADPCIVSWPARLGRPDELRRQFTHAIDVMPTILELDRHRGARVARRLSSSRTSTARASRPRCATRTRPRTTPPSTSRCSGRVRSTTTAGRP